MNFWKNLRKAFAGLAILLGAIELIVGPTVWHEILGVLVMIFGELLSIEAKMGETNE